MEDITHVGPSKLDLLLAEAPELSDESKTKVIVIIDIIRLGTLMGAKPIKPREFYALYDADLHNLEATQHNLQVEWNTIEYHKRVFGEL